MSKTFLLTALFIVTNTSTAYITYTYMEERNKDEVLKDKVETKEVKVIPIVTLKETLGTMTLPSYEYMVKRIENIETNITKTKEK